MSSGLRLRRPVFFAGGLRCPACLRRIALCPVFLPVFRLSLAGPHFPLPAFPFARVSLCPHLASFVGPSSFVCILSGFSSVISCFSVHRPSPAACCPSPIVYPLLPIVYPLLPIVYPLLPVVHPLPLVVHRSPLVVRRPLSIPCCPLPVTCRPLFIARCVARTPSPCRASFRCRSVRITAFVSAESRPACLRELLAVSFRSGFRRSVFPQKCVRPPYLGRRAVSDKITPCILLSGAIFPAWPAILLTIWQRLPFGTTFVQIQGVTGAPDPQGGRTPAARKENGKNINN